GDDQGVIARRDERTGDAVKHAASVVLDARRLAVHRRAGAHDAAPEHGANRLMTETDAEHRRPAAKLTNDAHGDAGLLRPAGTGRDHDAIRSCRSDFVHRYGVVAQHAHVGAELAQVLHEVIRERIVVIDDQYHCGSRIADSAFTIPPAPAPAP